MTAGKLGKKGKAGKGASPVEKKVCSANALCNEQNVLAHAVGLSRLNIYSELR